MNSLNLDLFLHTKHHMDTVDFNKKKRSFYLMLVHNKFMCPMVNQINIA